MMNDGSRVDECERMWATNYQYESEELSECGIIVERELVWLWRLACGLVAFFKVSAAPQRECTMYNVWNEQFTIAGWLTMTTNFYVETFFLLQLGKHWKKAENTAHKKSRN